MTSSKINLRDTIRTPWLWLIILIPFIELAILSIHRYQGFNATLFDLGLMSQSIWSVFGDGAPLVFTIHGVPISRLARHVELFYFLLAPIYALIPSPATLLVIQAALYASAAWPLYTIAQRHLNHKPIAALLTITYLLYPIAQTSVLFGFHGDTLGMPLLIFALEAADRRAWRTYTIFLLLALSTKFYVGVPVFALGLTLWWQGDKKIGQRTTILGLTWALIAFFLIRPLFAPPEAEAAKATFESYLLHYFGEFDLIRHSLPSRALNLAIIFAPALPLAWRGYPWLLPALSIIGPVIISTGNGPSYDYRFHHYALAVPFLMMAIISGTAHAQQAWHQRPPEKRRFLWHLPVAITLIITIASNIFLVDTPLNPLFFTTNDDGQRSLNPLTYLITDRDRFTDQWLQQHAPADVPLIAHTSLGLHLVNRPQLYSTNAQDPIRTFDQLLPTVDYVITDAFPTFPSLNGERHTIATLLQNPDFHLTNMEDGLMLWTRQPPGLTASYQILTTTPPAPITTIANTINLHQATIIPLGPRHFQANFIWSLATPQPLTTNYIALTQIGTPYPHHIPHLPTLALYPIEQWTPNQFISETFEFTLPADTPSGQYPLTLNWYNGAANIPDNASRLGQPYPLTTLTLP
ncbi:MAG TPA: DUF2079 domain-containing protein [Anaerolineae bacterium]|nr:DUF2079 domain-containing protein [Anaerolineae bacterium]